MQNSEWNLAGKTYLVSGASSGIGAETAVALGRHKAEARRDICALGSDIFGAVSCFR